MLPLFKLVAIVYALDPSGQIDHEKLVARMTNTATFATEAQCQEFLSSPGGQISAAELKGLLARADQPVAAELTCVAAGDPA